MGQITADQSQQIMAILATNVNWSEIDFDQLGLQDAIIRDPKKAGEQFTAFLKNRVRLIVGEPRIIQIDRSKPFNPTEFIGVGWTIWRGPADGGGLEGDEDQDARSIALTQIDLSKIVFDATLKQDEGVVTGEERIKRLKKKNAIRIDAKVFEILLQNKELIPARFKEKTNGNITYIFVDGTILRGPSGSRCALCFYWFGSGWRWGYDWLDDDRIVFDPSALLAS